MEELRITGPTRLQGEVTLPGAKNSIAKLLTASMLTPELCVFFGVPEIGETAVTCLMCESLGLQAARRAPRRLEVQTAEIISAEVPEQMAVKNRLSVMMLAPLLHRTGNATLHAAGGDRIGPRPVDFHLAAYRAMGAEVVERDRVYHVQADRLRGASITLPYPSVTATENILMAASVADGTTELRNAAIEPEVLDLASFLSGMGARINRSAGRTFVINGVRNLHGTTHQLIPDRLVAASIGAAAIATRGDVLVRGAREHDLQAFLNAIQAAGAKIDVSPDGIRFRRTGDLDAVAVETTVHPGFMTDWHPPMALALTQARGTSVFHETVFEDRFGYARALTRMGADIHVFGSCLLGGSCRFAHQGYGHSALVKGPTPLHGAEVVVPDLRAGFTHLIAAVAAEGESRLFGAEEIDRGYERIDQMLQTLGAQIQRVSHDDALIA